jgi:hypothetical protein
LDVLSPGQYEPDAHLLHTGYRYTVPPHVLVRFFTLALSAYVALVAVLLVDQPKNTYPERVNVFAVNAFAVSYVWVLLLIVPLPPLALYATVYVQAVHAVPALFFEYPLLHVNDRLHVLAAALHDVLP